MNEAFLGGQKFIFRIDNVHHLQWGARQTRYHGNWKIFPDIVRNNNAEMFWNMFQGKKKGKEVQDLLRV